MISSTRTALFTTVLAASRLVQGISLDVTDTNSIKNAASTIAFDMMSYYSGNTTSSLLGLLPQPYYWWEAGAMWGAMIDYWHYTGDTTYNEVVNDAILSQISPTNNFSMADQTFDMGNDDLAFWAMTAMTAAEYAFPVHGFVATDEWLELAINVFNDFVPRWNTTQCNGGFKWQFIPANNGFDYKSSIANGGFFNVAARLARYTGNTTYSDWATKTWDWMVGVNFLDENTFAILDGAGDLQNCSVLSLQQWTYNSGVFLHGAAVMASISPASSPWLARTQGILKHATTQFFGPYSNSTGVMYESQCETVNDCDNDQFSFKAYLSRWMAATSVLIPSLEPQITALLTPSAQAAAASCTGGASGTACGTKWYVGGYDGLTGVGQQMSALETVHALLAKGSSAPAVGATERRKRHVHKHTERRRGEHL